MCAPLDHTQFRELGKKKRKSWERGFLPHYFLAYWAAHTHEKREGKNIVRALLSLPVRFCVHFRHWIHSVYWKSRNFSENFAY